MSWQESRIETESKHNQAIRGLAAIKAIYEHIPVLFGERHNSAVDYGQALYQLQYLRVSSHLALICDHMAWLKCPILGNTDTFSIILGFTDMFSA